MQTKNISSQIKSVWSNLLDWNPTDKEYLPADIDVIRILAKEYLPPPWKEGVNECEEIARRFMVQVRDWELANGYSHNQALGVAFCSRHRGKDEAHTLNICVGEDVVYLLDMQTQLIWIADPDQDEIYFVEM